MPAREFLNVVEALMREDVIRMNAADPEALQEALEDLDDFLGLNDDDVGAGEVGLFDPGREAAWADMAGG